MDDKGFDIAAVNYDSTFTNSAIGKFQRNQVHNYLKKNILKTPLHILELNCGTGEDAIWLAKQNHNVEASDISKKMIEITSKKVMDQKIKNINFSVLDINLISKNNFVRKFDLIFSNFGGLNCISKEQLSTFFNMAPSILNENGKLLLVIMPKNCLWEQLYFLIKGQWKKSFRRKTTKSVFANVDGEKIETWYYNPIEIVTLAKEHFNIKKKQAVGLFIPPSYLEPFFNKRPRMLNFLNSLEQKIKNIQWLAKYADHYIIELTKK